MSAGVVIAGGGQAGFQTAFSLRAEGYQGPITLIGEEPYVPYQRPPLSKGFVLGTQTEDHVWLRPESYYSSRNIRILSSERVTAIETPEHRARLASGTAIPYDALVVATGASNRMLPIPGAQLDGVCYLRTLSEAIEIKQRLEQAQRVVVIGGGFIGLEIAASARTLGKTVTVLEALPRLMARVVAPIVSEFFFRVHTTRDVEVLLNSTVREIRGSGGRAGEVVLQDGASRPADLVIAGIGILPNTDLAQEAGLPVANGIYVDDFLTTADSRIYAIGDCAEYPNPFAGSRVRLESVQNAVEQAVCVAKAIAGKAAPYRATPWFWSDQFDLRLQMAGLPARHDRVVVRGHPEESKFSAFYFRNGELCAVDSVNRPADHLAARRLIGNGTALTPEQAADEGFQLKRLLD
ncbi:MAG: FAD-dependent oxidoreductase [Bryobacterales bacterium]|nr:FAD-dependent oxidoreductase [Bryobacterales bacterium]MBV9397296.1 FAD-dependent oxidoreductase [Bryobacterales bacterium]